MSETVYFVVPERDPLSEFMRSRPVRNDRRKVCAKRKRVLRKRGVMVFWDGDGYYWSPSFEKDWNEFYLPALESTRRKP